MQWPRWTLTSRLSLAMLGVFVAGTTLATLLATSTLRESLTTDLSVEQSSAAKTMAAYINSDLRERQNALRLAAERMQTSLMANPTALQQQLEARPVLQSLFNRGTYITDATGTAIASSPVSMQRLGRSFIDRDYVVAALREGRSTISNPLIARTLGAPIIAIAVPIRRESGEVIGAWVGATDLKRANFLDVFVNSQYAGTGTFTLIAPASRSIITATDKSQILQQLPVVGVNAGLDRLLAGDTNTITYKNPQGVEVMATAAKVPISSWLVVASLPTQDAFRPVKETTQKLWLAAGFIAAFAALLIWWLVSRQLRPLVQGAKHVADYVPGQPLPVLPVTGDLEIIGLFHQFNLLTRSIDEQRRMIAERETRLRTVAESDMLGIFYWDAAGEITSGNNKFLQMCGYTHEEIESGLVRWRNLTPAAFTLRDDEALKEVVTTGVCKVYEKTFLRKDGSEMPIEIGAALLPGATLNGVAFVIDISARKAAERAASSAGEVARAVMDSLPESIAVVDANGTILKVNSAWQRFSSANGGNAESAEPTGINYVSVCEQAANSPEAGMAAEAAAGLKDVLSGEKSEFWFEYPCDAPDNPRWFRLSIVPLRGIRSGAVISHKDITQRKLAESARLSLEEQLREAQKMEAIGTLAGGIAHDFNNVLANILGNTELARQDTVGNADAQTSLEEIRKAGTRARDLVKQILTFSRRQPTEMQSIALGSAVAEAVRLLRSTMPARVRIEAQIAGGLPNVLADATQIQQVVINLSTNAAQAMKSRGSKIDLKLDLVALDAALAAAPANQALRDLGVAYGGPLLRLVVADDGDGMTAEIRSRIFEPFFTTKPAGEGTGLGLSVVFGIVQRHGGTILVDSAAGEGTTFTIYLPAHEDASIPPEVERRLPPKPPAADRTSRLLYLDDDESMVYLVCRLLTRRGYTVKGFSDQNEALAALRAAPEAVDLVVTDYNMPGMSGLDVSREVQAIRANLPVAIASGFVDEILRTQADHAGVSAVIFKASGVEEFCAEIEKLTVSA